MSLSNACCNTPPVESNLEPKGTVKEVGGISSYVVGDEVRYLGMFMSLTFYLQDSKKAIVVAYDIFGFQ